MTAWFSLRRRLLIQLLAGVSALWLLTLVLSYIDAHHEIDELFDAQLAQSAAVLLSIATHEAREMEDAPVGFGHEYPEQHRLTFQIWSRDGRLLMRSPQAPETPLVERDGFSEATVLDHECRYFSQWDSSHELRVIVGEDHAVRDELVAHIAARVMVPMLFGLPLLGGWIWLATRRALRPLDAVADEIAARDPERLHDVAPASAPVEIRPLVDALNGLFVRVEHAMENERRFTADAAHELRTPLAALAAHSQVAQRAADEGERRHALEQLSAGIARASHLVDQLLTLARLDPERGLASAGAVRLDLLAQEVCADHGTQALAKEIALELDAAPAETVADGDLLRILVRNLVDNAIRYTPPGGRVHVTVAADGDGPRLTVADSGPGIPAAEHARVFERFSRLAGQDQEGSGLGLSIVRRIADLHAATVSLAAGADGCGLLVTVAFALSPANTARRGTS